MSEENKLVVVIRDERTKANNKLSTVIGLSAIAFLLGSVYFKNTVEYLVEKFKEVKETESEGE